MGKGGSEGQEREGRRGKGEKKGKGRGKGRREVETNVVGRQTTFGYIQV